MLERIDGVPWTVSLRTEDETYLEAALDAFICLTEAIETEKLPTCRLAQSIQGILLTLDELFEYHPAIYALPEIEKACEDVKAVYSRLIQEPSTWYIDDPGPDNLLVSERGFERFVDANLDVGNRVVHVAGFLERLAHRTNSLRLSSTAFKLLVDRFTLDPDIIVAAALLRSLIAVSRYHRWNGWNMWPDRHKLPLSEAEERERARYYVRSILTIRRHLPLNPML